MAFISQANHFMENPHYLWCPQNSLQFFRGFSITNNLTNLVALLTVTSRLPSKHTSQILQQSSKLAECSYVNHAADLATTGSSQMGQHFHTKKEYMQAFFLF